MTTNETAPTPGLWRRDEFYELVFVVLLALLSLFVTWRAFQLPGRLALFPLLVLVPLDLFLLLRLGLVLTGVLGIGLPERFVGEAEDEENLYERFSTDAGGSSEAESASIARQIRVIVWVFVFAGGIYAFGVLVPIPVLLLLFLLVESDLTPPRSVALTVFIFGLIYLLFVRLLRIPLYNGVVHLPLP